jgi:DNA processing protein
LPALRGRTITLARREDCQREIEQLTAMGGRMIALGEAEYPYALSMVDAPPPLLQVIGTSAVFERPMVAFVGSRNASAVGLAMTERLVRDLGAEHFVVVSGLARGIDARAHRSSLQSGTIAVVAGGLDRLYPANHQALFDDIIAHEGAVVSEMPLGWEPRGRDFPRRNRIVAGLCFGTIVVEAARRSGSLITARFALEMGREVFAVPGSPLDPRAEGTNDLIRQGATMCLSADDVLTTLRPLIDSDQPHEDLFHERKMPMLEESEPLWDEWDDDLPAPLTMAGQEFDEPAHVFSSPVPARAASRATPCEVPKAEIDAPTASRMIVDLLSPSPIGIDDLVRLSGLEVSLVQQILCELEIEGRIDRQRGMHVTLMG